MSKKQTKIKYKEKINFFDIGNNLKGSPKVNINIYSQKLPKDILTTDVIDYDFMKVALNPPKKMKRQYYYQKTYYSASSSIFNNKKNKNDSNKSSKHGGSSSGGSNRKQKQLCMFKCFYSKDKKQHLTFLKNYMPQKNKDNVIDKPILFNDEYDEITEEQVLEYEKTMDDMHFKFILSPESQKVPIKDFVKSYMKQLEAVTGYSLKYMAVQHTDTGHNHAHILINGIDRNGKVVHFDRDFFKEIGRTIASNLCTNYVGYRTQTQIEASKEKALNAFHLTSFDKKIIDNEFKYEKNIVIDNIEYEGEIICKNEKMKRRLELFSKLGFAKLNSKSGIPPIFYLVKNWESSMRSAKNFNSFLQARTNLLFTSASNLEQYKKNTGEISGTITHRYLRNYEDNWNNAVVIENKTTGKAYYVPVGFEPDEKLIGANVRCFIPSGFMHPKILVQKKELQREKSSKDLL